MRTPCSEETGECGHWQSWEGQHCCAGTAREGQPCAQLEAHGSLPSPPPSLDKKSVSWPQKQQDVWGGKIVHLAKLLDSPLKGEICFYPTQTLIAGRMLSSNAGGQGIFSLPFLPSFQMQSMEQQRCELAKHPQVQRRCVRTCQGQQQQFLIICPHCFRYVRME